MALNRITPEMIAALLADQNAGYTNPETGTWQSQSYGSVTDPTTGQNIGYLNSAGARPELYGDGQYIAGDYTPGGQYNIFDKAGDDTGRTGQYGQDWNVEMAALKSFVALLAAGFGGAAMMGEGAAGAGAAGAGEAGGAAAGGMGFGDATALGYDMGAFGGGATGAGLGGGAAGGVGTMGYLEPLSAGASGLPGEYVAGAGLGGGAGAGGGAAAGGYVPWESGFEGTGAISGAGAIPGAGTVTGGGGVLSSLGGASSWLGPASTLVGALSGSQGSNPSATSQRQTDPRVDPYLFGANGQPGVLGAAYNQMMRDQSPESIAQRDQIRSTGMGYMNQPMAGNGFNRFFSGR